MDVRRPPWWWRVRVPQSSGRGAKLEEGPEEVRKCRRDTTACTHFQMFTHSVVSNANVSKTYQPSQNCGGNEGLNRNSPCIVHSTTAPARGHNGALRRGAVLYTALSGPWIFLVVSGCCRHRACPRNHPEPDSSVTGRTDRHASIASPPGDTLSPSLSLSQRHHETRWRSRRKSATGTRRRTTRRTDARELDAPAIERHRAHTHGVRSSEQR